MGKIRPVGISVRELIDTYEGLRGGPAATFELLAYHLRQGNIRARAEHVWKSQDISLQRAWATEPAREGSVEEKNGKVVLHPEHRIPSSIWWKSVDWKRDKTLWHVKKERFCITVSDDPVRRIMIRGLRIHIGDAARLFDIPKKHKSRDNQHNAWRSFWHEIIKLMQDGRDDLGLIDSHSSDNSLAGAIVSTMPGDLVAAQDHAGKIKDRIPYQITGNAIEEEVAALREAFGRVKRRGKGK